MPQKCEKADNPLRLRLGYWYFNVSIFIEKINTFVSFLHIKLVKLINIAMALYLSYAEMTTKYLEVSNFSRFMIIL